jgi:hypothetical protein
MVNVVLIDMYSDFLDVYVSQSKAGIYGSYVVTQVTSYIAQIVLPLYLMPFPPAFLENNR